MKVRFTQKSELRTMPVGSLCGGDAFRLSQDGAIYIRARGASGKLGVKMDQKLAVVLSTGTLVLMPSNKEVYPVDATVLVTEIDPTQD